jgi:hypothetical protein
MLTLGFGCGDLGRKEHPNYTLKGEQTGYEIQKSSNGEVETKFGLEFELTSKCDTLPPFLYWTCSWFETGTLDSSIVDFKEYYGGFVGCDKNAEIFTSLKSNEVFVLRTILARKGNISEFKDPKVRIGFIVIDTIEVGWSKRFWGDSLANQKFDSLLMSEDHIVWSNIINLKETDMKILYGSDAGVTNQNYKSRF